MWFLIELFTMFFFLFWVVLPGNFCVFVQKLVGAYVQQWGVGRGWFASCSCQIFYCVLTRSFENLAVDFRNRIASFHLFKFWKKELLFCWWSYIESKMNRQNKMFVRCNHALSYSYAKCFLIKSVNEGRRSIHI